MMYMLELSFVYDQQNNLTPIKIVLDSGTTVECPLTKWVRIAVDKLPNSIVVEGSATGVTGKYKSAGASTWNNLSAPITLNPPQQASGIQAPDTNLNVPSSPLK